MDSMQGMRLPDIERWSERVVVVRGLNPGPFTGPGTNTFLLGGGGRPLLLDTGAGEAGYVPLLEGALRDECRADELGDVLVTHVHLDHLGGARDVLARFGERRVSKLPWPRRDAAFDLALTPLGDGDVVRADGVTLRAIHTPGHAQDHLCYYLEEEKALFTGDLILGAGTTVIPTDGGDMALYLDSLERLLALDLERIYPAHGPAIRDPYAKIREYLAHRRMREAQIVEALGSGPSGIGAIVERVYVGTPVFLHAAAAQSVRAHLVKLERDGVVQHVTLGGVEQWSLV
jgi:glyoxylase-like metal-dependent hydrolase (beta-lactamase superfamily II)